MAGTRYPQVDRGSIISQSLSQRIRRRVVEKPALIGLALVFLVIVSACFGISMGSSDPSARPQAVGESYISPGADSDMNSGNATSRKHGEIKGVGQEKEGVQSSGKDSDISASNGSGVAAKGNDSVGSPRADSSSTIIVAVVCHVAQSGLVTIDRDSRIEQAVTAAGGIVAPGTWDGLNRAQKVTDGQQICVGTPEQPGSVEGGEGGGNQVGGGIDSSASGNNGADSASSSPGESANGKININTATAEQLATIVGIGPKTAAAIVSHRKEKGAFSSIDQLGEVKGIGPAKLAAMRDSITV